MTAPRKMPKQKPGQSEQVVCTPPEFLAAVARRFGPIRFDLAADAANSVAGSMYYGPGSLLGQNALAQSWQRGGVLYCNPPFGTTRLWVAKAREEGAKGARIHMLIPASVSSRWFAREVHHHALVLALRPKLMFVGHDAQYPKDLMLCVWGPWVAPGFDVWKWKEAAK